MKKFKLGLVCCLLILSCQIPESLTVKGNPGLYVPLGSPFANMKDEDRLENLISANKIKEMMNSKASAVDTDNELSVYEVSVSMAQNCGISAELQTYMVKYPLTEMPLNLEEYLNDSMSEVNEKKDISIPEISGLTGPLPPGSYYYIYGDGTSDINEDPNNPFFKVPLNDMVKLVKKVTRDSTGRFGMEINYTPQLAEYLEIEIPAFGINYKKGTPDSAVNPTKLIYADQSGSDFTPRNDLHKNGDDSELLVYARISGPCAANIEPGIVFEWLKAIINTDDMGDSGAFNVEYPIENSLGNFLGGGVSFKKVDGYVYMSGIISEEPIVMTVDIGGGNIQTRNLQEAMEPFSINHDTNVVNGNLTTSSFTSDNPAPLNLTPIFETEDATLKVVINIQDMEIENNDDIAGRSVKFNLYVLIPMDLKVSEVPEKGAPNVNADGVNIKDNYVQLDLGDMLAKIGEGDLFGRKKGKEDNLLKDIDFVELTLKGVDISIMKKENLKLLVKTNNNYKLLEFKEGASLKFDGSSLGVPFSPEFIVLLKKDVVSGSFGSFEILRTVAPKFDFRLEVKAKAKIDYTMEF
jgi:hypothetical protein